VVDDQQAADRIRKIAGKSKGLSTRKMFGGVCHLLNGNIFCGLYNGYLILRLGEKGAAEALRSSVAHPFDIAGRPMKGWVMVAPEGWGDDEILAAWIDEAKTFVATLKKK
jgi:TfoX/Sxy family transcriptional regulator of competence genes